MKAFTKLALFAGLAATAYGWGGKGDPIITGFDNRDFEFVGKAGRVYNVLSEKTHQLSMKLKPAKMWDHEGTYITSLGFKYQDHTVEIAEGTNDDLIVTLDGQRLTMRPSQTEQEVILGLAQGEMQLLWQLHRPNAGNAVEISTDKLKVVAYLTPKGTRDEGGVQQPSYLNFDLDLLAAPAHDTMKGILGGTYAAAAAPASGAQANDFKFHGVETEFEMSDLFETSHTHSLFGKASGGKARKLLEDSSSSSRPSSSQQQYPSTFGAQQQRPAPNGDLPAAGNSPPSTLRVHIAEQYRTSPPVLISQDLLEPPKSSSSAPSEFGLELEKEVLAQGEERPLPKVPDAWRDRCERFSQLGFSRTEVGLALAGCTDAPEDESQVASFCEHFKELKAMGFSGLKAFGALSVHHNDMSAATDACLAAP